MATSRDAILAACLQILGVSPTINPDYDLTVRAALLRVLLSGLAIDGTGVISTTQPINVPVNVSSATGTLAVGHGGTGLTTVAVNRLLYASALDTITALASANNGVLVTNGSGVPSISVTLPSGLTITAPIFSGSIGSDLLFTDATFDIGKSAATRPRDLFLSRNATIGGTTTFGGNILSDLLFTDATFDLGKTGATRPRDGFFSRNLTAGGTLNITGTSSLAAVTATTVTPSSLVDVSGAGAGQVKFPSTQNASANANTLDDYSEGTWTPVLGGSGGTSGQTYSVQSGFYVKVGKLVWATCTVTLTAKGTITTNAQIQGLPFTSESTANNNAAGYFTNVANLGTTWTSLSLVLSNGATAATMQGFSTAAVSQTNLATADITNTTTLTATIVYRANA